VRGGGLLIADFRTAQLNEHCRDMGMPQLHDLFGIGEGEPKAAGASVIGDADEGSFHFAGKELKHVSPGDLTLTATTGKPLAHSGQVPMVVLNNFGKGRAVYLNMDLSDYAYERLNPKASSALPDLLEGLLGLVEIQPRLRVLGQDGKRLPGTEIVVFQNGEVEHVAIFRNPQLDDGGWGSYRVKKSEWRDWTTDADNSAFEKREEVTIEWPASKSTYDVRAKKDLGSLTSYKATLSPWEPLVYTRSSRLLGQMRMAISAQQPVGSPVTITFASEEQMPEKTVRVVRVEVLKPSGEIYSTYSQNLTIASLPYKIAQPTAFNDPLGTWTVRGVDVMTGQAFDGKFSLVESPRI
jgi:hypothetical protein